MFITERDRIFEYRGKNIKVPLDWMYVNPSRGVKGVFCTNSICIGFLFIFFDIFLIFNSTNPKIVIVSKVIIISANVNLCALEIKIDGIIF